MDIGAKIKRIRLSNQLTLEELANRSELTKGFLSQLERDLTSPRDRKSTRLNSSHKVQSRMPSSA